MKIILVRHGRPEIDLDEINGKWCSAKQFGQVIDAYGHCALAEGEEPTPRVIGLAADCNAFFSSTLPRARATAKAMGIEGLTDQNPLFDEAAMPHTEGEKLRLPIGVWSVLFRLGWMVGFNHNSPKISQVGQRAKQAAEHLIEQAREHQNVMLFGHGIINRMIANHLGNNHWRMMAASGDDYWSCTVFTFAQHETPPANESR